MGNFLQPKYSLLFNLAIILFGILCALTLKVDGKFVQKTIYLLEHQNQTTYIDCQNIRTGSIALRRAGSQCPSKSFFVNLRAQYGQDCSGHLRFFLNIRYVQYGFSGCDCRTNVQLCLCSGRNLQLDNWEKVGIFGSVVNKQFGQMLTGKGHPHLLNESVPSVAQFFTVRDTLRFEYTRSESCQESQSNLEADFSLIQSDSQSQFGELWCPALNGYLPKGLFCHAAKKLRISCPQQYSWSNYASNPGNIFQNFDFCSDYQSDHDIPKVDDTLDLPDKPDTPDQPDIPDSPDLPDQQDTADLPDTVDSPDTPDLPDTDTRDPPEHRRVPTNQDLVPWENAMYPFPFEWTPAPFNEEDQDDPRYYDSRYRHRRHPPHTHQRYDESTWSIIMAVAGAIALVVVVPALVCWACCRRGRSRVSYERSMIAPTAPLVATPAYGTFDGPASGRDNVAFYRAPTEAAPLVYPTGSPYAYPYGAGNGIPPKS